MLQSNVGMCEGSKNEPLTLKNLSYSIDEHGYLNSCRVEVENSRKRAFIR